MAVYIKKKKFYLNDSCCLIACVILKQLLATAMANIICQLMWHLAS